MEMQQAQASDGHYRQTSYEDRADYYPGQYPPSHQHQAQEDYLAQHQAQQRR